MNKEQLKIFMADLDKCMFAVFSDIQNERYTSAAYLLGIMRKQFDITLNELKENDENSN
jgi:hypothetical protein